MVESKVSRPRGLYLLIAWLAVLMVFMVLELTVFGNSADLNNSIILALSIGSVVGLLSMRKVGVGFATFALSYTLSFNAFNIIYFPQTALLNAISAIIGGIAVAYMFATVFNNKYK